MDDLLSRRLNRVAINASSSANASTAADSYIFVDDQGSLDQFVKRIDELRDQSGRTEKHIFLDCEGKDLGCSGGQLGLVQVGVDREIYLIDVIQFPESIPTLKQILEDEKMVKVLWDARNDFSELWHGHEIHLQPVLDLQLLIVYQNNRWRIDGKGWAKLDSMGRTFSNLGSRATSELGVTGLQFQRMNAGMTSPFNQSADIPKHIFRSSNVSKRPLSSGSVDL